MATSTLFLSSKIGPKLAPTSQLRIPRSAQLLANVAFLPHRHITAQSYASRRRLHVVAVSGRDHDSGFTRPPPAKLIHGERRERLPGLGLTKKNELFLGRFAMIGFAAALLVEAVSGRGVLFHLHAHAGVPLAHDDPLALAAVALSLLSAVGAFGDRGRFEDDEPVGPGRPRCTIQQALGLHDRGPLLGMSKASELFVARLAELGLAATLVAEVLTGRGVLAHLNVHTGVPLSHLQPALLAPVMFLLLAAAHPGSGRFVNDD
ncbi:hypothetical protein CLOM_g20078 [Closterium sp. NIES-68]|nr:hypothetical protein CLOM_g20078 [Closterium sp. NIES-68]GJP73982.1 hypothetical protein CLOP_g4640 [Closterium sp. NIES-67]